jgi:GNAT superfamily N-acetyltransferase
MKTLTVDGTIVILRPCQVEEIIDLRHAVLRQGLPRSEAIFEGDHAPTSRHYAAVSDAGGAAVCCATLHPVPWEGEPAWQLRGMATMPQFRGRGIGRELMALIESDLLAGGPDVPRLLWCNARVPALGFYRGRGWHVISEQFDIPTAGPHFRMLKRLTPSGVA